MSEQVQLVDILQTDDWNKSELQSKDSIENIETNAWNDELVKIRNASKKRDKALFALTIILLMCFLLAVTVIVTYLEGKRIYNMGRTDLFLKFGIDELFRR